MYMYTHTHTHTHTHTFSHSLSLYIYTYVDVIMFVGTILILKFAIVDLGSELALQQSSSALFVRTSLPAADNPCNSFVGGCTGRCPARCIAYRNIFGGCARFEPPLCLWWLWAFYLWFHAMDTDWHMEHAHALIILTCHRLVEYCLECGMNENVLKTCVLGYIKWKDHDEYKSLPVGRYITLVNSQIN